MFATWLLCVYFFCRWALAHLFYPGCHWASLTTTSSIACCDLFTYCTYSPRRFIFLFNFSLFKICLYFSFLHKVILFLRRLLPPYGILNSEDLPVRFRLVHCSLRLHAPSINILGPFRNSESGLLTFPRLLLCLQGP